MNPESVGLSSQQLSRIEDHLRARYLDPGKIAGCITLVARRGEIAYLSCLGMQDIERDVPMSEDTIFRIYSMTKPITSVALMTFYEQGFFQLSDPVGKFLPEFRNMRVYGAGNHPRFLTERAKNTITVRDLLTHTSGLTYGFMERTNVDAAYRAVGLDLARDSMDLATFSETAAKLPLEFEPGTAWNYSISTDICGRLCEVFGGKPFDEVLQERIFEPLGMEDTGFTVSDEQLPRFAASYERGSDRKLRVADDPEASPYRKKPTFLSGGGGLVSTVGDYHRFCEMLLGRGTREGARVLGPRTVELMTLNHLPGGAQLTDLAVSTFSEVASEGRGFGLGFSPTLGPRQAQTIGRGGDYGWGGMASTLFSVDPGEEMVILFMVQFMISGTFDFRGQLRTIVYPAILD